MELKYSDNKLLYIDEHLPFNTYVRDVETGFKYIDFNDGVQYKEVDALKNYLVFFIKGDFTLDCNQYKDRSFHGGEMVLIPRSTRVTISATKESNLLVLFFDTPDVSSDKFALQSLSGICEKMQYEFKPTEIKYPLTPFLEVVIHCISNGMSCLHLHEIMQSEFFFLLRGFYTKEEIASLFWPIIGKEIDFKDFVLANYAKVENIEQLISLSNLGRSTFFLKFNEVFGMTAKQWMLKQRNQRILEKMSKPNVFIKDVVDELGFDSQIYFSRYCKKHFGCTPRQLIARLNAKEEIKS